MDKEKVQAKMPVLGGEVTAAPKNILGKKTVRTLELLIFSILQYIFLPVLCGFLTAGILTIAGLEKLGFGRFGFANFPTIKIQAIIWSNYPGLMVAAGLGCVIGMLLSRFMRFGARLGHFDFISPTESLDAMPRPSVAGLLKSIIRLIGIPAIIVLSAVTTLELAKNRMLPAVNIDTKYQLFQVNLAGVVIVSAFGCLLMFLYDAALTILLRLFKQKEVKIEELR